MVSTPSQRPPKIIRHDVATLAAGYSPSQHRWNIGGLVAFAALGVAVGVHVFARPLEVWPVVLGVLAGWVATDLVTGFVHWAGDTWGRPDMPIIGRSVIRTFREHHIDAKAITHHGLVQTLGEQAIGAVPVMALLWLCDPDPDNGFGAGALVGLYVLVVASTASNLFHKWAHMKRPPRLARALQKMGLIMSLEHHARHHRAPHLEGYCIAIGWLNPLLDGIGFWRGLEWLVWKLTGAVPREDDLGRDAALALLGRGGSARE
ncbi:MAG: fatty acid desaturase CarF family protein [Myxococcota bacterium]